MTKPLKTRKTFKKNNFAEHNYNYVNTSQTTHPPRIKKQNHLFSQNLNFPITSTNSVNFHNYPHPSQDQSENYPFSQQNRNTQKKPYYTSNYFLSDAEDYSNQIFLHQPDNFAP